MYASNITDQIKKGFWSCYSKHLVPANVFYAKDCQYAIYRVEDFKYMIEYDESDPNVTYDESDGDYDKVDALIEQGWIVFEFKTPVIEDLRDFPKVGETDKFIDKWVLADKVLAYDFLNEEEVKEFQNFLTEELGLVVMI